MAQNTKESDEGKFLGDLERPGLVFANLGPNWFAVVMGTGIVATAAATLPVRIPGLHNFGLIMWVISAVLLVALLIAWAIHWTKYRSTALKYIDDPILAQFYGAPPMAILTVGLGTMLLGKDLIGVQAAVVVDWILWPIGTISGLICAVTIPYVMFTRGQAKADGAFGGWLMPLVPPMVAANAGAVLVAHLPAGQAQLTMVMFCYAMFGVSLVTSIIVITLIWARMVFHPMLPVLLVPTLWIVLGPLGQSITAANNLSGAVVNNLPGPFDDEMLAFGLLYGIPTWGFAVFWAVLAGAITIHVARQRLPFGLTWWSFTFPVGTCVTATSALALRSESDFFRYLAVVFFFGLLIAWVTVSIRTFRHGFRGRLFLPPALAAAAATEN